MPAETVNFDRAATFYDETRGFPPEEVPAIATLFCEIGRLDSSSRALEIGIGTGRIALPLAERLRAVHGIDVSRQMMQRLRKKLHGEAISLAQGDARYLPYASDTFEAVIAVHVLHLIPEWSPALDEMMRVVQPQGTLIFGGQSGGLSPLQDIWRAIHESSRRRFEDDNFVEPYLHERGFRLAGRPRIHEFVRQQTPRNFLEMLRQRCWSNLWSVPDAELAAKLDALEHELRTRYDNLDQPVEIVGQFSVRGYRLQTRRKSRYTNVKGSS